MDMGIAGKTALVLAAGSGLGAAIAHSLAREGVRVAIAGRTRTKIETVASSIRSSGGDAIAVEWDLADMTVIDGSVALVERSLGGIDILVNNTGGPPPSQAAGQEAELWRKAFETLVLSVIKITDRTLPGMRDRQWGRIITSTSSGVIAPIPNLAFSNALRASLVSWSKTLASEVGSHGITANVVVPGRISTERITALDNARAEREGRALEAVTADSLATIPIGRYGHPSEYGEVVTFLASERAAYITGSVLRVDGGLIPSI